MSMSKGFGGPPLPLALVELTGDVERSHQGSNEGARIGPERSRRRSRGHMSGSDGNYNLPESVSSFVGRQDDVVAVTDMVGESRLVTVAGSGGVGKTRLALEVAKGRLCHGADGAWLAELAPLSRGEGAWIVELAPVRDGDLVPHAVVTELLGPDSANGGGAHELVEFLRERRALLVLDNCEHLVESCVKLVSQLLRSCSGLRILTTSREPLGITGERVWWLQPLPVPSADFDAASLAANDSIRLFVDRARDSNPGFAASGDGALVVAEICRRVDGLPLALELAAARSAVLSPGEILARLDDPFHLLTGKSSDGDARHWTLRATLEWSHDLLAPAEAVVFRRLAAFAGTWSLPAAEQVCSSEGVAARQVLDLLSALVAKSLVVAQRSGGATRYRMLGTIRDYARSKLEGADEAEAVLARHARWCVDRAEEAESGREGIAHEAWLGLLDLDQDNFRAALTWARDRGQAETALRLANALTWFWQTRGNLREGLIWLRSALSAGDEAPSAELAQAMRNVGRLVHMLGDHSSGLAMIDRSVALFRKLGDVEEAGGCVCKDLFHMCQNPLHAVPHMEQNVARMRTMDDPSRLAHALSNLGQARFFRGEAAGARSCFAEVLGLRPAGIDGDATEQALLGLARVALLTGDYDAVEPPLREVLDHAQRVGDPDGSSAAFSLLGELARVRGDSRKARSLLADAVRLAHEAGAALSIGRCELFLAAVDYSDGAMDSAQALFTQAMHRVEAGATLAYHRVRCSLGLADVAAATGNLEVAASLYAEVHEAALANGDDHAVARSLAGRADLAWACADGDAALRLRHQSLELEQQVGDLPAVTRSLEALAALATSEGQLDKGARLFGAACTLRDKHGFARPAGRQIAYCAEIERTRQGLGLQVWEEAWDQGCRLSIDEALSYARKGRGRRGRPAAGWDSLTPAEWEVVALVVEGLTNPEVGERLFISRRTVGNHLGNVYAKLAIRSRQELTREALRSFAPNSLAGRAER